MRPTAEQVMSGRVVWYGCDSLTSRWKAELHEWVAPIVVGKTEADYGVTKATLRGYGRGMQGYSRAGYSAPNEGVVRRLPTTACHR